MQHPSWKFGKQTRYKRVDIVPSFLHFLLKYQYLLQVVVTRPQIFVQLHAEEHYHSPYKLRSKLPLSLEDDRFVSVSYRGPENCRNIDGYSESH